MDRLLEQLQTAKKNLEQAQASFNQAKANYDKALAFYMSKSETLHNERESLPWNITLLLKSFPVQGKQSSNEQDHASKQWSLARLHVVKWQS